MVDQKVGKNQPICVMLVEDNLDHARLLEIMLKRHKSKFDVIVTTSGIECLNHLKTREDVDVIILDYDLPDMSGLETLSNIKAVRPDTRFHGGAGKIHLSGNPVDERVFPGCGNGLRVNIQTQNPLSP